VCCAGWVDRWHARRATSASSKGTAKAQRFTDRSVYTFCVCQSLERWRRPKVDLRNVGEPHDLRDGDAFAFRILDLFQIAAGVGFGSGSLYTQRVDSD